MYRLKELIKRLLPKSWLLLYHRVLSHVAAVVYRNPSRKMLVIGVTGTKGKSTTCNMIWKILTDAGHTVGLTGTANFRIGEKNMVSPYKMTMPGRFVLQRTLRQMLDAGCDVVIVETTSEGVVQSRHLGIHYDVCVFTNLTPEHIESHGGFENYKNAKLELFRHLNRLPTKSLKGRRVEKVSVVNMDSEQGKDFLAIGNFRKVTFGSTPENTVVIGNVVEQVNGTDFTLNGAVAHIPLLGAWNATNAGIAAATGLACTVSLRQSIAALATVEPVPGRMEFIDAGQPYGVIVDYAYEPVSLRLLFTFARTLAAGHNVITLISSTGGGRDVARRAPNGTVAGELCDFVIVTDEDPYDEHPQTIIDQVAEGVCAAGKIEGEHFWRVLNRRDAIRKAVALAKPGDVVLLTAKGAEQKMCVANGRKIPWDDRKYVREAILEVK